MKTKYIAFHEDEYDTEIVVIFSEYINHRDFANAMARLRAQPISAGFIQLTSEGPVCYGRSESLNLDSRPERDTELARRLFHM